MKRATHPGRIQYRRPAWLLALLFALGPLGGCGEGAISDPRDGKRFGSSCTTGTVNDAAIRRIIRQTFGDRGCEALRVAQCESGTWGTEAQNGQYRGLFQMGTRERAKYGHSGCAETQAAAAHQYFLDTNQTWGPWECKPYSRSMEICNRGGDDPEQQPVQPEEPAASCVADERGQASCVHGTVTENGNPVANIYVSAWGHDWDFRTTTTDSSGVYSFSGLHRGVLYNMAVNTVYENERFRRIDANHPCEVRDNVNLESGPDGWHGEWFTIFYEGDPDRCRGTM